MQPILYEFRDPLYGFIEVDDVERAVIDSPPFQRLRHIHQLAMTYMVYPSATHKRFAHSLGVMHLASQVYDVITNEANLIRESTDSFFRKIHHKVPYWKQIVRLAALCHDLGHLPFSHAAEKELLPAGWNHERLTVNLILSKPMETIWKEFQIDPVHVAKVAVGKKDWPEEHLGIPWENGCHEEILSKIITGGAFGVDRADYLLRDSHHCGVDYGKFDRHRLIQNLRVLPDPGGGEGSQFFEIGLQDDGREAAKSLLHARDSMFLQVYLHRVRRAYDIHLKDFLVLHLDGGKFPTKVEQLLLLTDAEVLSWINEAANDDKCKGHAPAKMIKEHNHFKTLYMRNRPDFKLNPMSAELIYDAACKEFDPSLLRLDVYHPEGQPFTFPVHYNDGTNSVRIVPASDLDPVFEKWAGVAIDFVFVHRDIYNVAQQWLDKRKDGIVYRR